MRDDLEDLIKENLSEFNTMIQMALNTAMAIGYPLPPMLNTIPTRGIPKSTLDILTDTTNFDNLLASYVSSYTKLKKDYEDYIGWVFDKENMLIGYHENSSMCLVIDTSKGELLFKSLSEPSECELSFNLDLFDRLNVKLNMFKEHNKNLVKLGEWEALNMFDNPLWNGLYLRNKNRLKGSNLKDFATFIG